jgi:uncharacterized membrane protein (DUF485 family)
MVSPEPGAPTPDVGGHSYSIPSDLLPASLYPGEKRTGLIDAEFIYDAMRADVEVRPARKGWFLIPAILLLTIYCCAMAVLWAYARTYLDVRIGPVDGACIFVFSQLTVAWIVAAIYVRGTGIFEREPEPVPSETRTN